MARTDCTVTQSVHRHTAARMAQECAPPALMSKYSVPAGSCVAGTPAMLPKHTAVASSSSAHACEKPASRTVLSTASVGDKRPQLTRAIPKNIVFVCAMAIKFFD